jgi:hypothetical protein
VHANQRREGLRKAQSTSRCVTCGRDWPVDSLREQCERGDHMEPREVNRGTEIASRNPTPTQGT